MREYRRELIDGIVLENLRLVEDFFISLGPSLRSDYILTRVPKDFQVGYVDGKSVYGPYVGTYEAGGLVRKCSDVALFVKIPNGKWAAVAVTRGAHNSFPNKLWLGGGAPQKGLNQAEWTMSKAAKEFGLQRDMLELRTIFGTYTTTSDWETPDGELEFATTTQECYAGVIKDFQDLANAQGDEDHKKDITYLTLDDLRHENDPRFHWYPHRIWMLGLLLLEQHLDEARHMITNPKINTKMI